MNSSERTEFKEIVRGIDITRSKNACEDSLYEFVKQSWHIVEPATPLIENWHLETICAYMEAFYYKEITRLIICVPPGTMKSLIVSVFFPAWAWAQEPGFRFLGVANGEDLATRDSQRQKWIVESEWFQDRWPLQMKSDMQGKGLYGNEYGGFRQAVGINARITGKRGDCLVGSTLIETEIGKIQIETLCGMHNPPKVWSFNHDSNQIELRSINATRQIKTNKKTVLVSAHAGNMIECTPDHLIYTDQGYVKAAHITGRKVSVLRESDISKKWSSDTMPKVFQDYAEMRNVRQDVSKRLCRVRKERKAWSKVWSFLQQGMQQAVTQQSAYCSSMRSLRKGLQATINKGNKKVLLERMLSRGTFSIEKVKAKAMRAMRDAYGEIKHQAEVLQYEMQKQGALCKNDWKGEYELQKGNWKIRPVSPYEANDYGERQSHLQELRFNRKHTCASYRREREEQQSREFNNSVHGVSQYMPQSEKSCRFSESKWVNKKRRGSNTVYDLQVEGNHNFFANGILVHNCMLIDDPHDAKNILNFSDIDRINVLDNYDQKLSTRLNHQDTGGICLIMQRLHTDDLAGHLMKKKEKPFTTLIIPMEYEGDPTFDAGKDIGRPDLNDPRTRRGELMFKGLFSKESVASLKENLADYGTAGQLQQRPTPKGGGIIKKVWWRMWKPGHPLPFCKHIFASYDTAFTERDRKQAAYTARITWGIFEDEETGRDALIMLEAWWDRVGYPDLRKNAKRHHKAFNLDTSVIERKASGYSLLQDLRKIHIPCRGFEPKRFGDKEERAALATPFFESGLVFYPERQWAKDVVDFVAAFPNGAPPSADLTDVVTQSVLYTKRRMWLKTADEDLPDPEQHQLTEEDEEDAETHKRPAYG